MAQKHNSSKELCHAKQLLWEHRFYTDLSGQIRIHREIRLNRAHLNKSLRIDYIFQWIPEAKTMKKH